VGIEMRGRINRSVRIESVHIPSLDRWESRGQRALERVGVGRTTLDLGLGSLCTSVNGVGVSVNNAPR
jgi:hypothetical protein